MREKKIPVGEKDTLTGFSQSLVQSLAMTASKIRDEYSQRMDDERERERER